MTNIANTFVSYKDWSFTLKESDITRNDKSLLDTQSKIDKVLDSIANFTFYGYKKEGSFDALANYHLQIAGAIDDRKRHKIIAITKHGEKTDDYKTLPIPTESEFEDTKDRLLRQMKGILKETYLNKGGDSKEFLNLYHAANTVMHDLEERKEARDELIKTLENAQNNPKYAKSQEFLDDLLYKPHWDGDTSKKELGKLWKQQSSEWVALSLRGFFTLANEYEVIPKYKHDSIERALQISEAYLYNQAGEGGQSYKIGNFVIKGNKVSESVFITYLPNKPIPLISDFDSTQSFLEVLDKRDQLEKQNQDLKAKQDLQVYSAYNEDSTHSIMQALLKDSKEVKDNKTLTIKTIEIKNI